MWNEHGVGRFTRELCAALLRRRSEFRYTLIVDRLPDGSEPSVLSRLGAEFIVLSRMRRAPFSSTPSLGLRTALLARQARFDLMFCPSADSFQAVLPGTPTVVTFHDTIPERFPELAYPTRRDGLSARMRRALARQMARRVMTVSEASARDLASLVGIDPRRIDSVSEAADPAFCVLSDAERRTGARKAHRIPLDAPLLSFVGAYEPTKNLLGLLQAMPAILHKVPNLHLAVVGDAYGARFAAQRELVKEAILRHHLRGRVHFTGYLTDPDLVALLNASTALICPSLWEGFGLPAVESMACGRPVLASERGSLPEVVGGAGLFFDPLSPNSIAASAVRLLLDADLRSLLAREALDRAGHFTWDQGAAQAERCFRKALA